MKRACLLCDNSIQEVKTACILVKNGQPIEEHWNEKKDPSGHAEVEAIKKANNKRINLAGSSVFVTRFPCIECAQVLIQHKVKEIYYMSDHFSSNNAAKSLFHGTTIRVTQIPESLVWRTE